MRVKRGTTTRRRHKGWIKLAKGFRGRRGNCAKLAKRSIQKALQYSYRDRRVKKRDFRALWILRINAACRLGGLSYSQFMHGLKLAEIELNRKALAELAVSDMAAFSKLTEQAKSALH